LRRGWAVAALLLALPASAVEGVRSLEPLLKQPRAWLAGPEAAGIADSVLTYQLPSGGWPKNVDMTRPGNRPERPGEGTIDNGATVTQLRYLALVQEAQPREPYAGAMLRGLDYLFAAQYPNGGWPQVHPLLKDYSRRITFNDGAMTNVLALLKEVSAGSAPFAFVDEARRRRAADAVGKGVRVILDAQIEHKGWCAQHDEVTLEPRGARRYEHPSLSGKETVDVVRFLMSLEAPPPEVVRAVEDAVAWLRKADLGGGVWARFYEIGTGRPIYSGRDGVVRYDLAQVEEERRRGYSWTGRYAKELLAAEYPAWKARRASRVVVAQDGSGDFRTVQEAMDAIPEGSLVLIRNGVYREKVMVTKSHLTLVGEDRERTRIEYGLLRREWRETHPDDWGAAVINIGPTATDVTLANLTVRNDYGATHGGEHDHQFAIRASGASTRLAFLDADILSDGADAFSPWNHEAGLTYASGCRFEGWVDAVCPRGWAYITDSRFFGHSPNATIWHDGSRDPDQKLVIRRSRFDGVPGFGLGRHHRDAQFYLLECEVSANAADRPIYGEKAPDPLRWGTRVFTSGVRGPYAWLADNLAPERARELTAAATFGGRWDPEATLPAVLAAASYSWPRRPVIALAGDSTVTDKEGWGRGFAERLGDRARVVNLAKGGRSSKSYGAEGLWADVLRARPDHLLIQFGHNDVPGKGQERETDADTFAGNLACYVDEARALGAQPILVTSLTRRWFEKDGALKSDLGDYVDATRRVAAAKGAALVDLNASSIALVEAMGPERSDALGPRKPDGSADRTHLAAEGSALFGAVVAEEAAPLLRPWSVRIAESVMRRAPDPQVLDSEQPKWEYTHGLVLKALLDVWQRTGDERLFRYVKAYYDGMISEDGQIRTYALEDFNIDRINPGKPLFALYQSTHDEKYRKAIELLRRQLREHPRTSEGGFWHKKRYPSQMWLDGLYMGAPFLAQYAKTFGEPAAFDDVVRQFVLMETHARDETTGLLFHGWDESRQQRWADPKTGRSRSFWGRAIGWYAMALVETLDVLPKEHPGRAKLTAILDRLCAAVTKVQDSKTGLWWQVMDQPARAGNYLEASVSSMLSFALLKASRLRYVDAKYGDVGRRAYQGMLRELVTVDAGGLVHIHRVCQVAGLGGDPERERYRDGTYEYYVNEKVRADDPKAVGPFIFASLEMERP